MDVLVREIDIEWIPIKHVPYRENLKKKYPDIRGMYNIMCFNQPGYTTNNAFFIYVEDKEDGFHMVPSFPIDWEEKIEGRLLWGKMIWPTERAGLDNLVQLSRGPANLNYKSVSDKFE